MVEDKEWNRITSIGMTYWSTQLLHLDVFFFCCHSLTWSHSSDLISHSDLIRCCLDRAAFHVHLSINLSLILSTRISQIFIAFGFSHHLIL
jgi:hypothetical protein